MNKAEVAVLIPHYNNPKELKRSLLSIQENINIDVVVVDDGSKEKPQESELINNYKNGYLYFVDLPENQGIEYALNKGLEVIQAKNYKYIGRLDCGDLCKENRFQKQIEYLNNNKQTYLLGTWVNIVDEDHNYQYTLKHPTSYEDIKNKMFYNSMFVHPSVIFRTEVLDKTGFYPLNYKAAEDYAFFFKIVKNFKSENYPEALLDYVIDSKSISSIKRKLQVKSRIRVILNNFYFGFYPINGLLRNFLLYFITRNLSNRLKRILKKVN